MHTWRSRLAAIRRDRHRRCGRSHGMPVPRAGHCTAPDTSSPIHLGLRVGAPVCWLVVTTAARHVTAAHNGDACTGHPSRCLSGSATAAAATGLTPILWGTMYGLHRPLSWSVLADFEASARPHRDQSQHEMPVLQLGLVIGITVAQLEPAHVVTTLSARLCRWALMPQAGFYPTDPGTPALVDLRVVSCMLMALQEFCGTQACKSETEVSAETLGAQLTAAQARRRRKSL